MDRYRLEAGPVPLHHQVYLDLRQSLDSGELGPGDRLPPERQLADRYGCSLITVRRALGELAREGRLERTRGRGTFVTAPRIVHELTAPVGWADEMQARGLEPFTRVVTSRTQVADATVAQALGLAPGARVHHLERIRGAGGLPLLLEQAYLPAPRFPGLLATDFERASLYETLSARYSCPIDRVRETIEPILPPSRVARLLEQERRRPALLLEGIAYGADAEAVEYSRTYVASDRARYALETRGLRARTLMPREPAPQRAVVAPPAARPRPAVTKGGANASPASTV